jgi:molybdopterin/thiamine biosynthesis adenylyltransferase
MDGENTVLDLVSLAGNDKSNQVVGFVSYLFDIGIVTNIDWFEHLPFDANYKMRLQKQIFFLMDMTSSYLEVVRIQKSIKESTVAIWGIGAVGSWLLIELLHMGFEKIKILDFDVVQQSDISRHAFFSREKCGALKIDAYKELCNSINPNAVVYGYKQTITTGSDLNSYLHDVDLIVNCSDEPYIGYTSIYLSRYCIARNKVMFIAGGFDAHLACLGEFIIPHITPCADCYNSYFKASLKDWKPIKHIVDNRTKGMGGLVSLSIFSASSAALSILKYFIDKPSHIKSGGRGEFKFDDYSIDSFNVERNRNCEVCGDK